MAEERMWTFAPPGFRPAAAVIRDYSKAQGVFEILEDAKEKIAAASGVDVDKVRLQLFIADEPRGGNKDS